MEAEIQSMVQVQARHSCFPLSKRHFRRTITQLQVLLRFFLTLFQRSLHFTMTIFHTRHFTTTKKLETMARPESLISSNQLSRTFLLFRFASSCKMLSLTKCSSYSALSRKAGIQAHLVRQTPASQQQRT